MYEDFFGFRRRPFASVPEVEAYFPAEATEAARTTLARCVERGEGTGMVVGPVGTGKTLLCHLLAEHFKDVFRVALVPSGRLDTRRALLQAILYELGRPYRGMDEGELRLALADYLTCGQKCPEGVLLVVDEAHAMPLRLLDELRMLTNISGFGQPRVRMVLAGNCALEERLANPRMDSFNQRLVARCYLEPFNSMETEQYIHARLRAAGVRPETVFAPDACRSVHQATDGVPRLVNQVCDHALLLAAAGGRRQIDPAGVQEAWADLQQLPTPWNSESGECGEVRDVIEFGRLEDLEEPARRTAPDEAPALRLSAPDEPPAEVAEAAIGQPAADDDFQPAGSIGPEVELVFEDAGHPFRERFEDEEVIVDRFGNPQQTRWPEPRAAEPAAEAAAADGHGTEGEPDWSSEAPGAPGDHGQPDEDRGRRTRTVPLCTRPALERPELSRDDLIVVEDDYDELPPAACAVAAVRRQQYGQLFARLRRG